MLYQNTMRKPQKPKNRFFFSLSFSFPALSFPFADDIPCDELTDAVLVWTVNPARPALTITAFIVNVSKGDTPHGTIGYQSIFAAGLTLFLMTLGFNILGHLLRKRFREAY